MHFGLGEILGLIGVAGIPLTLVLTMPATSAGEFRFLRLCLYAFTGLIIVSLFFIEWPPEFSLQVRASINAAVAAIVVGGVTVAWGWLDKKQNPDTAKTEVPAPLYAAQLEQLIEIDAFIGNKDETRLRETFDLPDMIKFNILKAKGQLFTWGLTDEEAKTLNEFFAGGQAQIDTRYAKLSNVNNAAKYEEIPGKFGLINLSKKYVENLKRLNELIASATIPDDVKKALTDFRDTVTADTTLMFDVINDCFQANPAQLLQNEAYGQPFYGSVTGAYATRFALLRPKADLIRVCTHIDY